MIAISRWRKTKLWAWDVSSSVRFAFALIDPARKQ
jgi:hypothetical protein